ncbi:AAA family ATPase [Methanobrevibacter sp.]|uniref:AAA family ATPase n=1 Tax=Methanobrevibacter sp. TaxID=66852 RepID=UPI00388D7387
MDFEFDFDRESPFQPGIPVSPDKFRGRQETIKKILRYVNPAINGKTQHFFLTGKRRMGKTSVADFVKDFVGYKKNMIGVYVSNKGNNSIEILTTWIIEALINELPQKSGVERLKDWFGDHIESIEIKGTKIKFKVDDELTRSFKDYFQDYINEIYDEIKEETEGILIIIDDINGLSDSREFADWYKKLADTLAVNNNYSLPVYFLLAGYPEKFNALVAYEESFGSIFHHDFIDCLSDDEVIDFFKDTFNQVGMEISKDALETMVAFSSGLPLMMQQIGESVFWACENSMITNENAIQGVINASYEIGSKQIRPILNQLKSENYEQILQFLVENKMQTFKRSDVKDSMEITDNVLSKFLSKMVELGILESTGHKNSGTYEFSNNLYYTYFWIKSFEKSQSEE